jgi:hypothetical protein
MSAEQFSFSFENPNPKPVSPQEQMELNQEMIENLSDEELFAKYKEVVGYSITYRFFSEDLAERRQQIIKAILDKDVELARISTLTREEDRQENLWVNRGGPRPE